VTTDRQLEQFDPAAKERQLRSESDSWDTSAPVVPEPGDVPTVDVGPYFASGDAADLATAAAALREASEQVGFHQLVGHGVPLAGTADILANACRFHDLSHETRAAILMDRPDWPIGGSGYLPKGERKLPRRAKGNLNEAFLVKTARTIGFDDNQWLPDDALPGFRTSVESYARSVEALALRLLPVYAVALDLEPDFFAEAFTQPFWRLRLTHYPPHQPVADDNFGIAPHVDTTFFTLLLQGGPGLNIFSERRQQWISVPVVDDAFVVNSGELLRQWSNDRFLSTRHFANNTSGESRYSVPFFFNANADYPMECLPSCHGPGNPPRYPTISYKESQAVVQGE
jgi:isopenicillin N synthase-like dioxygenase